MLRRKRILRLVTVLAVLLAHGCTDRAASPNEAPASVSERAPSVAADPLRSWAELDLLDDKAGKPVGIQQLIGRRPIAAFGNSDGDLQMLQWTAAGRGARFALFVHHDDAAREFAYDRADPLQKFDKGWDEATARGWTVVSMKNDWKSIYPESAQP